MAADRSAAVHAAETLRASATDLLHAAAQETYPGGPEATYSIAAARVHALLSLSVEAARVATALTDLAGVVRAEVPKFGRRP